MEDKRKILVVDDEAGIRKLILLILKEYDVEAVESVDKAYKLLKEKHFDVIITDVKMPGDSGLVLAQKSKVNFPDIPVILITGHGDREINIQAIKEGVFDYIDKPFDRDEIINAVKRALEKREFQEKIFDIQTKLQEASKMVALGEIAGAIAHEINNPLTVIMGLADQIILSLDGSDLDQEKMRSKLEELITTSVEISEVVNGLKAFSREAEPNPPQMESLKNIVEKSFILCKDKFRIHKVSLSIDEVPEDLKINCQPVQISQVFINLLNNSFYAIQDLPERWVKFEVEDLQESVTISVTDSGAGIPENIRKKLLKEFFTTKPEGEGTGIGLSISKKIIESHNGTIEIDQNAPNTRFLIKLPKGPFSSPPK